MLPLKWKIFRIICYLHIAAVTGFLLLHFLFNWRVMFSDFWEFIYNLILLSVMAVLLANTLINTWLLDRYYPDRKPGSTLNTWHIILLILFIIIISFCATGLFFLLYDIFTGKELRDQRSARSLMLLILLTVMVLTGIFICYFQIILRKTLRRNYQTGIESFLNT
jgi:hypothetical protein